MLKNTSVVVLLVLFALSVACIAKTFVKALRIKKEYYKDVDKKQ